MASSLLDTYIQFLRSPVLNDPPEDISTQKTIGQILRLYTLHFLLVMLVGIVITQFSGAQDDSIITDAIAEMSAGILFLSAVVAAPVLEELVFRLPMRSFAVNLAFSGSFVGVFLLLGMVKSGSFFLLILGMLVGFNLYLWIKRPKMMICQKIYERYATYIFYFLTLVFGAIHITNYEAQVWALLPLLVLPQVIIALWLGFVRVRYGFKWAIFAHAFHNGCLLLPIILTKLLGSAQLQASGLENLEMNTLTVSDFLLVGGLGLYSVGGLVACVLFAWKLLKDRDYAHSTDIK